MARGLIATLLLLGLAAATGAVAQPGAPIRLEPVVERGLVDPVFVTHAGDGSGRLFVVEQPGRVRVLKQGRLAAAPFLDIAGRVRAGGEQGLLGLAFHPEFRANGRLFVNYTRQPDGATVVSEFRVPAGQRTADPSSERILLTVPQPYGNHNGGMIAFGPGGRLFIGLGDGGGQGDPGNRAQNPRALLGKMLRIDVDGRGRGGRPYAIPPGNPFARGGGGRPEIFALGLRNPWRFSFDRKTGALFAGDVGQGAFEEIDQIRRGGNYGWRLMEGTACYRPATGCKGRAGLEPPVAGYGHERGRCSVTGGYVYRGRAIPGLRGTYLYGDFCSGEIFGLRGGRQAVLLETDIPIVSFGEGEGGELYVVDHGGAIYRIKGGEGGHGTGSYTVSR